MPISIIIIVIDIDDAPRTDCDDVFEKLTRSLPKIYIILLYTINEK